MQGKMRPITTKKTLNATGFIDSSRTKSFWTTLKIQWEPQAVKSGFRFQWSVGIEIKPKNNALREELIKTDTATFDFPFLFFENFCNLCVFLRHRFIFPSFIWIEIAVPSMASYTCSRRFRTRYAPTVGFSCRSVVTTPCTTCPFLERWT